MRFLMLVSMLGLGACAFFHAAGWASKDAQDQYPYFWTPAIVLFAVWIPAVKYQDRGRDPGAKLPGFDAVTAHATKCMKVLNKALFVYALVMFIAFMVLRGRDSTPHKTANGTYTVTRGKVQTTISEQ